MSNTRYIERKLQQLYEFVVPPVLQRSIQQVSAALSEEGLIRFGPGTLFVCCICLCLFVTAVALNLNGSSVAEWNKVFVDSPHAKQHEPLVGSSKSIRRDEWCVNLTLFSSQAQNNFPIHNPATGAENTPLLMNMPTHDVTSYVRPHFWGFFLLPFDQGYSFFWYYRVIGLFLSAFFLLKILTQNDFLLSLSGATWILFSTFTQWWLSTPSTELMISAFMICIGTIYLLKSSRTMSIIIGAIVAAVYLLGYVLSLYAPFQVSLGYLLLAILIGYSLKNLTMVELSSKGIIRAVAFVLALLSVAAVLYHFSSLVKESIQVMSQTEYPGKRRVGGGVLSVARYFGGYFDVFFSDKKFPIAWSNQCEASNFIYLYPFVVVGILIERIRGRKIDLFEASILLYILVFTVFMLTGLPSFITDITLLDRVPETRAFIGIGVASIILVIHYLSRSSMDVAVVDAAVPEVSPKKKNRKTSKKWFATYSLKSIVLRLKNRIAFVLNFGLSLGLMYGLGRLTNAETGNFFNNTQLWLISALCGILASLIISRSRALFSIIILALTLNASFLINPITKGLGALFDTEFMQAVKEIHAKDPDAKWLVYNGLVYGNALMAAGVNVINSTKVIPDVQLMRKLNEDEKFMPVYNRYAHINFIPGTDSAATNDIRFSLAQTDLYDVIAKPCAPQLQEIGLKYIVSPKILNAQDMECFEAITEYGIHDLWIYKRKGSDFASSKKALKDKVQIQDKSSFDIKVTNIRRDKKPDTFTVSGDAYDVQSASAPQHLFAEVHGVLIEAKVGLRSNNSAHPNAGFEAQVPFTKTGLGFVLCRFVALSKDGNKYYVHDEGTKLAVQ